MIRRLVTLISSQAALLAQAEASLKQAMSASKTAKNLISQQGEVAENKSNEAHDKEVIYLLVYRHYAVLHKYV